MSSLLQLGGKIQTIMKFILITSAFKKAHVHEREREQERKTLGAETN